MLGNLAFYAGQLGIFFAESLATTNNVTVSLTEMTCCPHSLGVVAVVEAVCGGEDPPGVEEGAAAEQAPDVLVRLAGH